MIAIIIWVLFAGLGFVLAAGSVAAFSSLASNLDPPTNLDKLGFQEESIIYDRTGTVELARFGATTRSVVTFADIPPSIRRQSSRPASTACAAGLAARRRSPSSSCARGSCLPISSRTRRGRRSGS
jgi:hypothetical protein